MIELINGNALDIPLEDGSVQCCITSPPYYGLRDYSVSGQLGLEQTPEEYVKNIVNVFREVRRVLRNDGTVWLNLGDSYATHASGSKNHSHNFRSAEVAARNGIGTLVKPTAEMMGLKEKDLIGIPWRVAFALQADGWYLRSDIIWNKTNCMPDPVRDRPTRSHEYVFLLTKSQRYYYDTDAIREPHATLEHEMKRKKFFEVQDYTQKGDAKTAKVGKIRAGRIRSEDFNPNGKNRRSVWTIPTMPYKGAHFATFPPALVEPMIKAGTSEYGCCPECGKPWERIIERTAERTNDKEAIAQRLRNKGVTSGGIKNVTLGVTQYVHREQIGWKPTCSHDLEPVPCVVLDPFAGSGTTLLVARNLGRSAVGLDLSYTYLHDQARKRLELDKLKAWMG